MRFLLLSLALACSAASRPVTPDSIRAAYLHAWESYKKYAWGHDALKPLSMSARDWYGTSLCLTPVDAYDGLVLMGLKEAAEDKQLILDSLSFDKDVEVQSFEITIRLLGGLLSAYQLDRDQRFLSLARDLADRLLPIYDTPTGMPCRFVNLRTGKTRDSLNNPAEIGTAILEFGTLSKLTGSPLYYEKSKNALVQLFKRRSSKDLVGSTINVITGEWVDKDSHIGGGIDSYYEYLLKAWLLFGDEDCKKMWDVHSRAINKYLADARKDSLWYGHADMDSAKRTFTRFGSLEAFFPATLCLAGDTSRAARLEESCFRMWNLYGIEPEEIDYSTMTPTAKEYYLRPEIIESAYYLYHYTKNPRYLQMGETFFTSLEKYCRVPSGYTYLKDVTTMEKADGMESFFFAETLKYLFLLFSPERTLPFDSVIFTTEAHPLHHLR